MNSGGSSHICVTLNTITKVGLFFPAIICVSIPFILLDMKKQVPPSYSHHLLYDISDWESTESVSESVSDCMATTICAPCLRRLMPPSSLLDLLQAGLSLHKVTSQGELQCWQCRYGSLSHKKDIPCRRGETRAVDCNGSLCRVKGEGARLFTWNA